MCDKIVMMIQENLIELFENSFKENWHRPALTDYFKKETFSYKELSEQIARLHIVFQQYGVQKGDRIAIVGRNNTRWCMTFLATISYGAVVVPILQDFNGNDIQHIINHSGAKLLFLGDKYWDNIDIENVPEVVGVFSLTDFSNLYQSQKIQQVDVDELFYEQYGNEFEPSMINYYHPDNDELVAINYTSGTTGFSKGVMQSAGNYLGNLVFARSIRKHFPGSRGLSFLPLAHAYGCTLDFLYPMIMGGHLTLLGQIPAPKVLMEAMAEVKPNIIFCVPLILEKIYKKQILPMLDSQLARIAMRLPVIDSGMYAIIRKKLMDAFGGEFDHIIVGGAPLNAEVEAFLRKIKFPFTVGYGMTECSPLISYTPPAEFKPNSCGMILPDLMQVRIMSPDPATGIGEVQVKGQNVMLGYYLNEQATSDIFTEDGWMRTGDMGTVDPDGTIYLRGRSKTMILTATGQNIYPEEIESKLNNMYCVMESLVVERNGRLVALVYPDYDQLDMGGFRSRDCLGDIMKENLKLLNESLANYEKVAEIVLFPNEFEKTPKKSIKRYLYNV